MKTVNKRDSAPDQQAVTAMSFASNNEVDRQVECYPTFARNGSSTAGEATFGK